MKKCKVIDKIRLIIKEVDKMKTFWKIFVVAFLSFAIIFSGLAWSFNKYMREEDPSNIPVVLVDENDKTGDPELDKLLKLVRDSKRVNLVFLGLEDARSDTIIFISFDPESKSLDGISIPRDTYLVREGYNRADQKKINAAYGAHGGTGVKTVVSSLLHGVPVDYYVTITYKGVEAIVDSIGGVPMYIPEIMKYDDPYSNPPTHIYIEPGNQVLNGSKSVDFLRYRQPNKGSGAMDRHGDLGRVKAQQEFIQSAMKKILGPKLPNAVASGFKHVKTDVTLQVAMKYAANAVGLKTEDINMKTLPGEARYERGGSYFFHDSQATKELLIDMYSN